MARSRVVVVTSLVLAAVIGLLALIGSVGFTRLRGAQDRLELASSRVGAYAGVQRVVADELAAEAGFRRAPGPETRARLLAALGPTSDVIRRADLGAAETASLLVLQDRYATELRRTVDSGDPSGALAGPALAEMQLLLGESSSRALTELDLAAAHQRTVVRQMSWRAPTALLFAFVVLALCWRLLVAFGTRALARAQVSEQLAMRDPLTGLANRRSFEKELAAQLAQPDPDSAVLMLDLDGFKAINDTWGHEVGDKVLTTVADRLLATVRDSDLVARIGGDEFAVLARPAHQAEVLKERLAEAVARPMPVSGVLLHPSVSVGWAAVPAGAARSDVLREADIRLYDVKRSRVASGRRLGARHVSH